MAGYTLSIRKKIFIGVFAYFFILAVILIMIYIQIQKSFPSSKMIIFYLVLLFSSGLLIAYILSRLVLKPFEEVRDNINRIADGKFQPSYIELADREINSLNESIKKMSVYLSHELEIRQKQLMHTEKLASLGTFLSGIAHELVNPLSNIYSSSQILLEEIEDADKEYQKELLTQIEKESDRARNIARTLLEFSREREIKKEMLPLKDLFEETVRFIGGEKPSRVDIVFDIPVDIRIYADKQRIQQAFLNIIKNSIEAISAEGSINIKAEENADEGFINIEIKDTGVGIDEKLLPKVFDAFFTTKDVGKGSGLGLFITNEIINELNGSIQVESQLGKGSKFLIKLPRREFQV